MVDYCTMPDLRYKIYKDVSLNTGDHLLLDLRLISKSRFDAQVVYSNDTSYKPLLFESERPPRDGGG